MAASRSCTVIEDALRKFAQENFSDKYYPALHGETEKIQPLALVVRRNRPIWKRPFTKVEQVILAELSKYVASGEEVVAFHKSKMKEEMFQTGHKISDVGARAQELDVNVRGYLQGNIKLNDDQGILELGKLSQKYIDDPDLREILANTTLDAKKMEMFEGENLLLITSVICSEKFELIEGRKHKTVVKAEVAPSSFMQFFKPNARVHYCDTSTPPELTSRISPGPFLFKCCHVDYIKEDNRLEIRKGEYVSKTVTR